GGGEPGFSNMSRASDVLPDERGRPPEPLHMVHSYEGIRRLEPSMPPTTPAERDAFPPVTHPLIRVHPDRGGRRSLYFTCNTSREIGGGTLEEGQRLHEWLREWADQARFCYYHRWRAGDLVMWDNRVLLHRAIPYDYAKYRRGLGGAPRGGGGAGGRRPPRTEGGRPTRIGPAESSSSPRRPTSPEPREPVTSAPGRSTSAS